MAPLSVTVLLPTLVKPLLPATTLVTLMGPALDPTVPPAPTVSGAAPEMVQIMAGALLLLVSVPTPPPTPPPFKLTAFSMENPFMSSEARLALLAPTVTAPVPKGAVLMLLTPFKTATAVMVPAFTTPDSTLVPPP